jgi:hypothetical protein
MESMEKNKCLTKQWRKRKKNKKTTTIFEEREI